MVMGREQTLAMNKLFSEMKITTGELFNSPIFPEKTKHIFKKLLKSLRTVSIKFFPGRHALHISKGVATMGERQTSYIFSKTPNGRPYIIEANHIIHMPKGSFFTNHGDGNDIRNDAIFTVAHEYAHTAVRDRLGVMRGTGIDDPEVSEELSADTIATYLLSAMKELFPNRRITRGGIIAHLVGRPVAYISKRSGRNYWPLAKSIILKALNKGEEAGKLIKTVAHHRKKGHSHNHAWKKALNQ